MIIIKYHKYNIPIKSDLELSNNSKDNSKILNPSINVKSKNQYIPRGKNICEKYDPYNLFQIRLKSDPIYLCKSDISQHLCYINNNFLSVFKKGVTCIMKNFLLNTSNWKPEPEENSEINQFTNDTLLSKGIFNMKCDYQEKIENFNPKYNKYFDSWDYSSYSKEEKNNDEIQELAPNKTIFFVSRNKDTSNLFFGFAGIINAVLLMDYFNLNPENIQVIFSENMKINIDPLYDIYKNVISRGNEPIHISQLGNKTFHIKESFYVPINWDSPCFTLFPNIDKCNKSTRAYIYFNDLINKYMTIPNFIEPNNYDKEVYYYPQDISNPNSPNYTTFLTVQWRKVWPKGRFGQERLLGDGTQLIETLYKILPKTTLIRLVDTANLTITEQISLMKKTDYFVGVHGAGLVLSVFLPETSIVNEINTNYTSKNVEIVSKLSGHKTYIDYLMYNEEIIDGNNYVYFNPYVIAERVYQRMNKTFYSKGFKHIF